MRAKIGLLEEAFNGDFDNHHALLLTRMLGRIDAIDADITAVDAQIEAHLAPFASAEARLDDIPGIDAVAAAIIPLLDCLQCDGTGTVGLDPGRGNRPTRSGR